jgi:hypothetical protein
LPGRPLALRCPVDGHAPHPTPSTSARTGGRKNCLPTHDSSGWQSEPPGLV